VQNSILFSPTQENVMPIFGYTVSDKSGDVFRFQVDGSSTTATKVNDLSPTFSGNGDDVEGLGTINAASTTACNVVGISESDNGAAADPFYSRVNRSNEVVEGNSTGRISNESGLGVRQSDGAVFNIQSTDIAPGPRTQLYRINPANGAATAVGPVRNGQYVDGLAITGNGTAYASDGQLTNALYRVSLSNGSLTRVGNFGVTLTQDTGLDAIRQGTTDQVYLLAEKGNLYRVNTSNGRLTFLKKINLPQTGANLDADYEGLALTLSSSCNPPTQIALAGDTAVASAAELNPSAAGILMIAALLSGLGLFAKKLFA
jgi:hypothetical protein